MTDTGLFKVFYDELQTNLKEEYFKVNGKKEGPYISYYINGQVWNVCNYINNKKEGKSIWYYSDGQIWEICNFVNDTSEGEYKCYDKYGNLEYFGKYVNGNIK
jgi:antitoxin component YwqK of YwqJK toxin-antitoxin module